MTGYGTRTSKRNGNSMHVGFYKYRANILPDTKGIPTTYYRGYVAKYAGNKIMQYPCDKVRDTRAAAIKDAHKLLKTLNH